MWIWVNRARNAVSFPGSLQGLPGTTPNWYTGSGDGETSQSIRQSPAWRGGWRGNLANGGETGETKKPDISYSELFRTKKKQHHKL